MNTAAHQLFLLQEEEKLQVLEQDKEYCLNTYETMRRHVSSCLTSKNYEKLLELCPYFERPDEFPHFHLSGEIRKIHIMLNFLRLELRMGKTPFVAAANDFHSFLEQYTLTVFALRRLELALDEQAMADALSYLSSIPLSIYAIKIITENECFENRKRLYLTLYNTLGEGWTVTDKILWLQFVLAQESSDVVLLELASLYLEVQDLTKACNTLKSISLPAPDTLELISLLEEHLHAQSE